MLQLKNITKNYGDKDNIVHALKGISIDFRESEFVSILGQSGCGKTTLLNILGGLDKYTSGDLIINGISTKEYGDRDWDTYRNHTIGFIFQSYNLIPHLSVLGNVEIALSLSGVKKAERKTRALQALESVGLADQAKKRPNQLSGGQMQRVAIARALVNNPSVILADEPTGALDSETSVQIMDILKSISKDKLIIMVTHNQELAKKYSTRIISMLDGNIVNDSNPYTSPEVMPQKEVETQEQVENVIVSPAKSKKKKTTKKYSAMKLGTSFYLSLRNLLSKKGRTSMTAFAGSIGIIGVALVLAISNGFSGYIDSMQADALGSHPVIISAISMDASKFSEITSYDEDIKVSETAVTPYDNSYKFMLSGHYNNFTSSFMEHVKEYENSLGESSNINTVEYNYHIPLKLVSTNDNEAGKYSYYANKNSVSVMSPGAKGSIYPLLKNTDFILDNYDLLYGHMPQIEQGKDYSTDMLLVVDSGNKVNYSQLQTLGFKLTPLGEGKYANIEFADICSKEFKVIYNNDYYLPNNADFENITAFDKIDVTDQTVLSQKFANSTTSLKISGILRLKKDAPASILSSGIAYDSSFATHYINNCKNSVIAQKQLANKSSLTFYDNYQLNIAELAMIPGGSMPAEGFSNVAMINAFLQQSYGYTLSEEDAFELAMQQIGISQIPVSIAFYPKNFEGKNEVLNMVEEYNNQQTNENLKIVYTDTAEFLTSTLGQIVNIISYVLVAFASISLIVSSVMIGVITYASVVERTKEIGVLRSLGARKKDISRVFNAETLLIGLTAGFLGILISYLLCPIINIIVKALSNGSVATNIAVLNPLAALALIAISCLLTFISGLIPSRIASKKNPVVALRVE